MTGSGLVYLLFFYTLSLFLYVLGFQPALPSSLSLSNRQEVARFVEEEKKKLHVVQKVCLFI